MFAGRAGELREQRRGQVSAVHKTSNPLDSALVLFTHPPLYIIKGCSLKFMESRELFNRGWYSES